MDKVARAYGILVLPFRGPAEFSEVRDDKNRYRFEINGRGVFGWCFSIADTMKAIQPECYPEMALNKYRVVHNGRIMCLVPE